MKPETRNPSPEKRTSVPLTPALSPSDGARESKAEPGKQISGRNDVPGGTPGTATGLVALPLVLNSRLEAENTGALVAALTLQINEAVAAKNEIEIQANDAGKKISKLRERLFRYEEALRVWAEANRSEFGESKTLELLHVRMWFKLGRNQVEFLARWTEAKVLAALRQAKLRDYIRVKESLDRLAILADARPEVGKLDRETMSSFGVKIVQPENFGIEAKLEPT